MTDKLFYIMIGVFAIWIVLCQLALVRNEYIYKYRLQVLEKDREEYLKLPGYIEMFLKFWVLPKKENK